MRPSDYMQRNPVRLDISRSKFEMTPRWTGSFNSYNLVPILTYTDVMPGDTVKLDTSFVVRMSTPVAPVMDDLFLDVAFYFVPHDLILSRSYMSPTVNDSIHSFKAFIGAQDSLLNMPLPDNSVTLPSMVIGAADSYKVGGCADCMGMPSPISDGGYGYLVNALAPLAFMAVWNENYRDPNTQNPGVFSISSNQVRMTWSAVGLNDSANWAYANLPNVCRYHGYFGSALPWPQRNSETVLLPLGTTANVIAADSDHSTGNVIEFGTSGYDSGPDDIARTLAVLYRSNSNGGDLFRTNSSASGADSSSVINRTNLVADLANASAVSINVFRLSVQKQRFYEALARSGNRFDEFVEGMFGVRQKDAGAGQPEYLGGKRIPLQVSQVNNTASDLGQTGAFSLTSDTDHYFTKSFDRWGSIIGVCCVRYRDSFGHSLNRMFTRHERFDFYFPQFANLGEQPVYKHELSMSENESNSGEYPTSPVFGYQEAWADYRTMPDIVCGLLRPGENLSYWTYANNLSSEYDDDVTGNVTLSDFIAGSSAKVAVDRSLQLSSSSSGFQFVGQFQHSITFVRPMPLYSIPGLVDHH